MALVKRRNAAAKELRKQLYRPRVVRNKKKTMNKKICRDNRWSWS